MHAAKQLCSIDVVQGGLIEQLNSALSYATNNLTPVSSHLLELQGRRMQNDSVGRGEGDVSVEWRGVEV